MSDDEKKDVNSLTNIPLEDVPKNIGYLRSILTSVVVEKDWGITLLPIAFLWAGIIYNFFPRQPPYLLLYLLSVILVCIYGFLLRRRGKRKRATEKFNRTYDPKSPIKGLLAFQFEDAEAFKILRRSDVIQKLCQSIANKEFRIGILSGESGCGKSSLLQAGLCPRLIRENYEFVFVELRTPYILREIRNAASNKFNIQKPELEEANLVKIVEIAAKATNKTVIFIFDQFEHFFINQRSEIQKKSFIKEMENWYKFYADSPSKFLFCFREEFLSEFLDNFQEQLGFQLSPYNNFRLGMLSPVDAAEIIKVMADSTKLEYDEKFIKDLCENDLADSKNSLVSPVSIQVYAEIIRNLKSEDKAFNKKSFSKIGGIEGLMETYLSSTLDSYSSNKNSREYKNVLKILRSLIDFDNDVRTDPLSMDEIYEKTDKSIAKPEIDKALKWLSRSDIRLLNPNKSISNEENNGQTYELAHDSLTSAIRKLTKNEITELEVVNHLLSNLAHQWSGGNKDSRYLLKRKEFKRIEKLKESLNWKTNESLKHQFYERSKLKISRQNKYLGFATLVLLMFTSYFLYEFYIKQYTFAGKVEIIKRELFEKTNGINDVEVMRELANVYSFLGQTEKAIELADRLNKQVREGSVSSDLDNRDTLIEIIANLSMRGSVTNDPKMFYEAIEIVNKLKPVKPYTFLPGNYGYSDPVTYPQAAKYNSLKDIADKIFELGIHKNEPKLLVKLLEAGNGIDSGFLKCFTLTHLAIKFNEASKNDQAEQLLLDAEKLISSENNENLRIEMQLEVAKGFYYLKKNDKSRELFSETIEKINSLKDPMHKNRALQKSGSIILKNLSLSDRQSLFSKILKSIDEIEQADEKLYVKSGLALAYASLNDELETEKIFGDALILIPSAIKEHRYDIQAGRITRGILTMFQTIVKVSTVRKETNLIKRLYEVLKSIDDPKSKGQLTNSYLILLRQSAMTKQDADTPVSPNMILYNFLEEIIGDIRKNYANNETELLKQTILDTKIQMFEDGAVDPDSDEFLSIRNSISNELKSALVAQALAFLAKRSVETKDNNLLTKTEEMIGKSFFFDSNSEAFCWASIGRIMARERKLNESTKYLKKAENLLINNKASADEVFFRISRGYASTGDINSSYDLLEFIRNDDVKAISLAYILYELEIQSNPKSYDVIANRILESQTKY